MLAGGDFDHAGQTGGGAGKGASDEDDPANRQARSLGRPHVAADHAGREAKRRVVHQQVRNKQKMIPDPAPMHLAKDIRHIVPQAARVFGTRRRRYFGLGVGSPSEDCSAFRGNNLPTQYFSAISNVDGLLALAGSFMGPSTR